MKDIIQVVGGFLVFAIALALIFFIWSDNKMLWGKIILTELILIVLCFIIDKGNENPPTK